MSLSFETLAVAKNFAKSYTDSVISGIAGGIDYKGAVNYYSDLPANPQQGDSYTVLYMGTSGNNPDGTQYVWAEYEGTLQWVPYGINRSLLKTYQTFRSTWTTNGTILQFCNDINADANASEGMGYVGELRCSDLPFNGNADTLVEIIDGTGTSNKVIHIIITSGNVYPYRWEYTYWNNGTNVSGWIVYQTELTAGSNITISNGTISATDTTYSAATTSSAGLMPALDSASVAEQTQSTKFLREDGTWAAPSYTPRPQTLTNSEVDVIWNGGYTITSNITNGTVTGVNTILFDPVQITIIPDSGYDVPESITVVGATFSYDVFSGVVTLSNPTGNVTVTATCQQIPMPPADTLENMTWAQIKTISDAGLGTSYFSVGDTKSIVLNGMVGTLELNNYMTYVYIIDFNHNSTVEGTGISFSGFKTAGTNGIDVALCDSHYPSTSTNGSKWFNMNHSKSTNAGGWQGCDLRYDILGSVEVKNQQDATSVATSSPVENTLIAALPSALRAVMKPITKYTDNVGGGTDTAANVTTTVDYLPLLAEYEIFGSRRGGANSTEQSHQAQYAFYANGNSKVKYNHSNTSSAVFWWERSAYYDTSSGFCFVSPTGDSGPAEFYDANFSCGVVPVFLV